MPNVRVQGESKEYRNLRLALLKAEIGLKDQRERVAELRRRLPMGAEIKTDYVFREGPGDINDNDPKKLIETKLSDLFSEGKKLLIVDHMMFDPENAKGCPMCSMWADGYNAIIPHITDTINFVLVAKAGIEKLRAWGRQRSWDKLRLLSSQDNTFNHDFNVEGDEGQLPGVSVFCRHENGRIYHFYTTEASLEYHHHRGIDLFSPVWHLLDLLPEGRGNWMPKHFYA